jgi:hypothetical protein
LVELVVQGHDFDLCFEVNFIVVRGDDPVFRCVPVLTHHDDRRLHGGQHGEDQVQENEGKGIGRPGREDQIETYPDKQEQAEAN